MLRLISILLYTTISQAQTLEVVDDHYGIPFGQPLQVEASGVLDNDTLDGEPAGENGATAELVIGPSHGILQCPSDIELLLCPDGSFDYTPSEDFPGSDSFVYLAVAGGAMSAATVTLTACTGGPDIFACWHESAYLSLLAELGYVSFWESFEGDAWDVARSPTDAPSVTSQGITWTSNHPTTNNLTTGPGPARTGSYGVFDPEHGVATGSSVTCNVDTPPEHCLFHDGFSGSLLPGEDELHGAGGFIDGSWGSKVSIILDGITERNFGHMPANQHQFIGLVDDSILGFRSYEFRETDGKVGQKNLIWGDDFTFAIVPPPAYECSGDVVIVSNTTVPSGITECIATTSITVGPNVLVVNGAELWLDAPEIRIGGGVTIELGATFHAGFIP